MQVIITNQNFVTSSHNQVIGGTWEEKIWLGGIWEEKMFESIIIFLKNEYLL